MVYDLGALIREELGQSESRFTTDDFAEQHGRRVYSRVRTRRTVRAAGFGGGAVLTASALVAGAFQAPWERLAPGVTDCVTASASAVRVTVSPSPSPVVLTRSVQSDGPGDWTVSFIDTGEVLAELTQLADGTWVVTYPTGETNSVELDQSGTFTIALPDSTGDDVTITMTEDSALVEVTVPVATVATLEPSPTEDCVTPEPSLPMPSQPASPSPSPSPSLAALPREDVIGDTPFECGFVFETPAFDAPQIWVQRATESTREEAEAAVARAYPDMSRTLSGDATRSVPTADFSPINESRITGELTHWGLDDPSTGTFVSPYMPEDGNFGGRVFGYGLVAVTDGVIVGVDMPQEESPEAASAVFTGPDAGEVLYLFDPAQRVRSCDGSALDLDAVDLYAVAGVAEFVKDEGLESVEYAWRQVESD